MQDVLRGIWSVLGVPQLWGLILTLVVVVAVAIIKLFINQAMKNQAAKFTNTLQTETAIQLAKLQAELQAETARQIAKLQAELQAETARQTAELQAKLQKTTEEQKFVLSQYASIATYTQEQHVGLMRAYIGLFEGEGATATGEAFAKIALKADNDVMRPFRKYQTLLDKQTMEKIFYIHNILAQFQDNPNPDVIAYFRSWKAEFYKEISDARDILQPEQILKRKGIISSVPYEPQGGKS